LNNSPNTKFINTITCPKCSKNHFSTHIVCPEGGGFMVAARESNIIKEIYVWSLRSSLVFLGLLVGYLNLKWVSFIYISDMILLLFGLMLRHNKPSQLRFIGLFVLLTFR